MTHIRLRSVEMLRAAAALLVVLYHTQSIIGARAGVSPFPAIFNSGFRGVDLFFVLSGFIISHVHGADLGRPSRLRNYLYNRASRIYPAVWITTVLAGCMYAAGFGGVDKEAKLGVWSLLASWFLLPQSGDALVNVTWTLKYEICFYLVFATMIWNRRIGLTLLLVWQAIVLIVTYSYQMVSPGVNFLPNEFGLGWFYFRSLCLDFSLGMACTVLINLKAFARAMRSGIAQWGLMWLGVFAFIGGMIIEPHTNFAGIPCAVGAAMVITGLVLIERSGRINVPTALVALGGASYAIYLVHFSVITITVVLLLHFHVDLVNKGVFLLVATCGIIAGIAFDKVVDQPIQRLLRRVKPMLLTAKSSPTVGILVDRNKT